ncbi:MAG: hypothetical protein Q8928_08550 [Bacteroidota bacterium]|nr:hypothetical protein [Bacteroidota bacterium]
MYIFLVDVRIKGITISKDLIGGEDINYAGGGGLYAENGTKMTTVWKLVTRYCSE